MYDSDGGTSPSQSVVMKVAKLIDSYLAEIAPDANLKLSKFIALAETLPDYSRVVDDGLYRSIDIYLKVKHLHTLQLWPMRLSAHKYPYFQQPSENESSYKLVTYHLDFLFL